MGFSIGVLTGLFGVGGGFLVVPLLNILLGVPYEIAVGSSLGFILITSLTALPGHLKQGNFELKAVLGLGAGSVGGAILGDIVQDFLIQTVAQGSPRVFQQWMHGFFLLLLVLTSLLLLLPDQSRTQKGPALSGFRTPLQRISVPPYIHLDKENLPRVSLTGLLLLGLLVGTLTGLMGVGGGVLFMPILLLVVGLRPKLAVGTSLGVVIVASFAGIVKKMMAGTPKVSLPLTFGLLAGSLVGVQVGLWICRRIRGEQIRRYFVFVIFLALGLILWDLWKNGS
ncbi:MAG: sulfite exporter TauE/SafE family protein [Spirochaetales bacterium]